jgi:hypothetical protein
MDAKESYRKVISNPWSWKFTSSGLFYAANDLCDLYQERLEAVRRNNRKWLKAENKRLEKEFEQSKAELEQLKTELEQVKAGEKSILSLGLKPIIRQDFAMACPGKMMSCYDININLKPYLNLLPVYMMLMGMAIENLAKGIKVARVLKEDNTIIDGATLKKLGILGHTAPDLIKGLGISLKDDEKKLLDDINEHLEWSGRYSAPSNEGKPVLSETVEHMTIVEIENEKVFEVLACLYKRLEDIFDMETEDSFIKDLPWRYYIH